MPSDPRIYAETFNYGSGEEPLDNLEGRNSGPYPGYHRAGGHYDYPDRLRPPEWPFGPASCPNWQPGYVPSATEWRSWFSRKYDTDDPTLAGGPFLPLGGGNLLGPLLLARSPRTAMEACTKEYADSLTPANGPFVSANGLTPFTGDVTMYGNLQVGGSIYADCDLSVNRDTRLNQSLYVQGPSLLASNLDVNADVTVTNTLYVGPMGAQGYQGACPPGDDETALRQAMWGFYVDPNTGDRICSYTNGAYNRWVQASGQREWWGAGRTAGPLMFLDGGGNLAVLGSITGGSLVMDGPANMTQGINIWGNVPGENYSLFLASGLQVNGGANIVGGLGVNNGLTVNGGLGVNNGLTVNGGLNVASGEAGIAGPLVVGGFTNLNGGANIWGNVPGEPYGLYVDQNIYAKGSITTTGWLQANDGLEVSNGDINLHGSCWVDGQVSVQGQEIQIGPPGSGPGGNGRALYV